VLFPPFFFLLKLAALRRLLHLVVCLSSLLEVMLLSFLLFIFVFDPFVFFQLYFLAPDLFVQKSTMEMLLSFTLSLFHSFFLLSERSKEKKKKEKKKNKKK